MSVSEWQCRELRRLTDKLGNEKEVSIPFIRVLVIPIMREAANTIESLRNRLQDANVASNYSKLFSTPEKAARTLSAMQKCELGIVRNCNECDMHDACRVRDGDYDALLEWMRSDAKKGEADEA